jgi:hypothetical protein
MSIDVFVFLFGLLVSVVLMLGLAVFYLPAYVSQSRQDSVVISPRLTRVIRILGLAESDAAR